MDAQTPSGDPEAAVESQLAELSSKLIAEGATAERLGTETVERPDDEAPESLGGAVTRGASLAGGGFVITQLLTFGVYLALARLATPADFGRF
ncbi:MAG TPA: hypothetical protein VEJ23_00585, partial [Solirubrobacteraceae bacterium]|nr:hypothetical protein [Solirubrobacteraceae bacterium]